MTKVTNRVLITGGCGYLGSQVLRDLPSGQDAPTDIRILDNMQSGEYRALWDLPEGGNYEFIEGDILDPARLRVALRDIDAVIHLAAVVHTPFSFQDPNWVEQVNHWGTSHLVEACLSAGVERFIYASTAAVYGPGGPFSEDDPCEPVGAYAHAKLKAERSVLTARDRGLKPTILRSGTIYGPAPVARFDAVANKFAKLVGVRQPLTVYGDGTQERPFVDVRDASSAIRWSLEDANQTTGQTFNLVGENASIEDIVDGLAAADLPVDVRYTEQDIRTHLSFSVSGEKASEHGWTAEHRLEESLAQMARRFRGFSSSTPPGPPDL